MKFVKIEKFLSLAIALIPIVIAGILFFFVLPDIVPHHINYGGEVTRTGGKWIILILPAILFILSLGLYWLIEYLSRGQFSDRKQTCAIVRMVLFLIFLGINIFYFAVIVKHSSF